MSISQLQTVPRNEALEFGFDADNQPCKSQPGSADVPMLSAWPRATDPGCAVSRQMIGSDMLGTAVQSLNSDNRIIPGLFVA